MINLIFLKFICDHYFKEKLILEEVFAINFKEKEGLGISHRIKESFSIEAKCFSNGTLKIVKKWINMKTCKNHPIKYILLKRLIKQKKIASQNFQK